MTYRAHIKKDYKPVIRWISDEPWYRRKIGHWAILFVCVALCLSYLLIPNSEPVVSVAPASQPLVLTASVPLPAEDVHTYLEEAEVDAQVAIATKEKDVERQRPLPWRSIEVKKGDSLSMIFDRLGLGPTLLYQIMSSGEDTKLLKNLLPGQKLDFLIENEILTSLKFEPNLTTELKIVRKSNKYAAQINITELDLKTNISRGVIESSLFLAGLRAGLSDNLIMQLVSIFGWDIDFALDIRKGDEFKVIFEEQYKDNVKVGEGAILAAEFTNRNQSYRTVRYTSPNGDTNYFSEDGVSMRKAFLRTPLKFSRISSRFNLRRKHPVLNRIRAHKGVDYAAPTGAPIKATGDGRVLLAGNKGGYGKTVILKHGGTRSTLYAHMSSFSRNIKKGKRVKQGQIIGYVGKSGLATGPHLHYEFQVNGVHRNPLTVKLPKASGIPKKHLAKFKQKTATILAQLEGSTIKFVEHADATRDSASLDIVGDSILASSSVN